MKKIGFSTLILIAALPGATIGQVKSVAAANQPASKPAVSKETPQSPTRARVLGNNNTGKTVEPKATNLTTPSPTQPNLKNHPDTARLRRANEAPGAVPTATLPPATPSESPSNLFPTSAAVTMAATQIYRVGANDVLDIQMEGASARESTLYTVSANGQLEYPLAGEAINVSGLTTTEISTRLRQRIKVFDNPVVSVTVRDYASHAVTITGFVAAPGRKILRREAMPLYALLAESLALPEAGRATITRQGRSPIEIDLADASHAATLVIPGDIIRVGGAPPRPTEFFYIGGAISSPGQKPFHSGLTLTQALLASGGTTGKGDLRIRISRLGPNGRLVAADHNLKKIQTGKVADPELQKGDRIEVIPDH